MNISRRNILIASAVALTVLIGIVVVVVVLVVNRTPSKSEEPEKPAIFTRCDGLSDPVEIKISSCPNSAQDGYCRLDNLEKTKIELSFIPSK